MSSVPHIVVVGASLGGLRAAEHIAKIAPDVRLTIVGEEPHWPYSRPPLSKEILTRDLDAKNGKEASRVLDDVAFTIRKALSAADWRLGCRARALQINARTVELSDGEVLDFDGLVIATGLRPIKLPHSGGRDDRYVLRTIDEAMALRARLLKRPKVCIIGGGFIGCEIASSARKIHCAVTVVEPFGAPMERAIGPELSKFMRALLENHGVNVVLRDPIAGYQERTDGTSKIRSVELASGRKLECELIVEAVGSKPNVEWLFDNGLDLDDGVRVDNHMAASASGRVVAVGDIARFPNPLFDDVPRRVEHWSMPSLTAKRAAATVVGAVRGVRRSNDLFLPMPSFWSDQFGLRIQSFGMPGLADEYLLAEGSMEDTTVAKDTAPIMTAHKNGETVGVIGVGAHPGTIMKYRAEITPRPSNASN